MSETLQVARQVVIAELHAVKEMLTRLGTAFEEAVQTIFDTRGRVVVLGMGKSGIIGQKIAATLASTGTPSFFVHPGEAFHGDLGMIKPSDVALLISNSGETEEVIRLLPFLEYQGNKIVAMTGRTDSTLALHASHVLDIGVEAEACPNNLAPTSSTTCALVMGDALSVALSSIRSFQPEDFARFHPGGSLGRKLLTRVKDVMTKGVLPVCAPNSSFRELITVITAGRLGVAVVLSENRISGVITDGDIRRALDRYDNPMTLTAEQIMTTQPITITADEKFSVAEEKMRSAKVRCLLVVDEHSKLIGILQIFDV